MNFSISRKMVAGFAVALLIMVITAAVARHTIRRSVESSQWVVHSHEVLSALQRLLSSIQEVEDGARGFALAGQEAFLEPYQVAAGGIATELQGLRGLTHDNLAQQQRLDQLERLVAERVKHADDLIALRRSSGLEAAAHLVAGGQGKRVMDEIRATVGQLEVEERGLLERRQAEAAAGVRHTGVVFVILSALNMLLVATTYLAVMRELRQRQQASAALQAEVAERQRAEQQLERFFTTSLDLFCIAGFDGYFKKLNRVWEQTLGWTIAELLAKPFLEFVNPDDKAATVGTVQKLADGEDIISFENRYQCKDGSYRWILWQATPTVEEGQIFATGRDITERKRREEEVGRLNVELTHQATALQAANKELEAFSYSVSHDLRAPLRGIDGFSKMLVEDYGDKLDGTAKNYLQRVRAGAGRMGQLIDDMLKLSRVTRDEMHRQTVDLSALAHLIADELQNREPQRAVRVEITEGLIAEGDPKLLGIALENLLGNAWKFAGKKPDAHIEFGRSHQDGQTIFFVRDNGAGFEMAYVHKLFGAFQRLHGMTEFEGTGIGLATVQRVIHRHGGRVWAEGEVDKGATFYFTL